MSRGMRTRLSSRWATGALAYGLAFCSPSLAAGEDETAAIDLRYEAPTGCPGRDEVLRAIQARAPRTLPSADDRSFRVHIERVASGDYRGRLEVARHGRVLSVREIREETCEFVSTAIAMFVALALAPGATDEDADAVSPAPSTRAGPPDSSPPPRAVNAVMPARWFWGNGLALASVMHPSIGWGGRVSAEIVRFEPQAQVGPALRVSWGWSDFSERPEGGGEVAFRFRTARVDGCALLDRPPLTAAGCAGFEAGTLDALTRRLTRADATSASWYAPVAAVRPGWRVVEWMSLEAEVGVLFPLTRGNIFLTDPERLVYQVPPVALTAGAGLRLWVPIL